MNQSSIRAKPFRLALVHPCVGRRKNKPYIRTWQMEPLPSAVIAALTPPDVEISFYDDRLENIEFDKPADLAAISVETYTARRSYQIASEYRRRGVPVVMGGFHATLCSDEVSRFAETTVIGEAENIWPRLIDDARHGRMEVRYEEQSRPSLARATADRGIFKGKRYLPIGLVEAARGCNFECEFCAIQSFFKSTQNWRPLDALIDEVRRVAAEKKLIFFVDDNVASNIKKAMEFFEALIPLNIRWVGQCSINAAHNEDFLDLLVRSGCRAVLIGFESLNPQNLAAMNKDFNMAKGGFEVALANLRRHRIGVYGTFIFGYDNDDASSFSDSVRFAQRHGFYIAAFNHLTPFPGTPLYRRFQKEGRLLYDAWWNDDHYQYNKIPFQPAHMSPDELEHRCVEARRNFYSWPSIARRALDSSNRADAVMFRNFFLINSMHRADVAMRNRYPLGDESWAGPLLPAH